MTSRSPPPVRQDSDCPSVDNVAQAGGAGRGGAPALRARLSVGCFARGDGVGSLGRDGHGARDRVPVAVRARRAWRWRERHHPHGLPASALGAAGVQPTEHVECCSAVRAVLPEPASSALGRAAGRRQRGQPSGHWPRRRLVLQPWRRRRRRRRWRQRRRGAARGKVPLGGAVAELTMNDHPLRGAVGTPRHGQRGWPCVRGESARQLWRMSPWDPAGTGSPQARSSAIAGRSGRTDVPPPAAQPRGRACSSGWCRPCGRRRTERKRRAGDDGVRRDHSGFRVPRSLLAPRRPRNLIRLLERRHAREPLRPFTAGRDDYCTNA